MGRRTTWTDETDATMIRLYPYLSNKELSTITGFTIKQLARRAGILNLKKSKPVVISPEVKPEWLEDKEVFLLEFYYKMNNQQLAKCLGMHLQSIRNKCYELGLYRMKLQYWTEEQIQFLKDNYQAIGDSELAEIFTTRWHKEKGWTLKHIEKKRMYLKLKRTKEELQAIQDRNVEMGRFAHCPDGRWLKYGVSKDGDIRMWRCANGRYVPFVKVNGEFTHWARHTWSQIHGPVPAGFNVVFDDGDPNNLEVGNLVAISNAE